MADRRRPAVSISVHPLWRLRLAQELPRYLLYAACAAGLLASARFAIAPPRPRLPPATAVPPPPDLAAKGYALLFARRYLTWDANQPQSSQRQLASLLGPGSDSDGGLRLPAGGEERVEWAEVVKGVNRPTARTSTRSPPRRTRRGCCTSLCGSSGEPTAAWRSTGIQPSSAPQRRDLPSFRPGRLKLATPSWQSWWN